MVTYNTGFTMLELTIVIAIIGTLAFFAIPTGINLYRVELVDTARNQAKEILDKAVKQVGLIIGFLGLKIQSGC